MATPEYWFLAPGDTLDQTPEDSTAYSIHIGNVYYEPKIQSYSQSLLRIPDSALPAQLDKTAVDRTITKTEDNGRAVKFRFRFFGNDKEKVLNEKFNKKEMTYTMEKLRTTTFIAHEIGNEALNALLANPAVAGNLKKRCPVYLVCGLKFAQKLRVQQTLQSNHSNDIRFGFSALPTSSMGIASGSLGFSSHNFGTHQSTYATPGGEWVLLAYQVLRIQLKKGITDTQLHSDRRAALLSGRLMSAAENRFGENEGSVGYVFLEDFSFEPVGKEEFEGIYEESVVVDYSTLYEEHEVRDEEYGLSEMQMQEVKILDLLETAYY